MSRLAAESEDCSTALDQDSIWEVEAQASEWEKPLVLVLLPAPPLALLDSPSETALAALQRLDT